MKTVKSILLILVAIPLFIQCNDDVTDPIGDSNIITEKFELEHQVTNARLELNSGSVVHFTGKSSCSLSNSIVYDLHGDVILKNQNGEFQLINGQMKLYCVSTGSYLFGEFEGIGNSDEKIFKLDGSIYITGGTDSFADRSGSLSFVINGAYLPGSELINYTLCMDGLLECGS